MKKSLSLILAVLLACGMIVSGAVAEEKNLYQYKVKADGTAVITGINDTSIESLNIPAEIDGYKVTSIGDFAFYNCQDLLTVTIPEGVETLESLALVGCSMLESISIPDSLVSVGDSMFRSERLMDVKVSPDHPVFAVENRALINKQDMTLIRFLGFEITGEYEITQGIRTIGEGAFSFSRFSSIVLPDSVISIGNEAFYSCRKLKALTLPDSVASVGDRAFECCSALESIVIPDSVTEIGAAVFEDCANLTSIRISPDHPVYECTDLVLVNKDQQEIVAASGALKGKYAVPDEITAISDFAFRGCRELKELFIPDSVTELGRQITGEDTVIRACTGSAAQKYCRNASWIRFTEISPEDFAEAVRKLEEEKANGTEPEPDIIIVGYQYNENGPVSGSYHYEVKEDGTAEITRADGFLADGNIPAELDGHKVTSIARETFINCDRLKEVVIPEGVVSVSHSAFLLCSRLESVSIPDSLVDMDPGAICFCRKLKTIEVSPDHPVFAVENKALVNKKDMTLICILDREDTGTYTVAQGIRSIEGQLFDCCAFSAIILPDSVTEIGNLAFWGCNNLTEIVLPEGVTSIGSQAFYGCGKLESVTIPDSVTMIEAGVFGADRTLTTIRISPDHPVYEMQGNFLVDKRDRRIVSALNSISVKYEIPEGIKEIGSIAFQGIDNLTELIVPEGVTKIGYSAFSGCEELRIVTLPASLQEIDGDAFRYSRELLIKAPAGSYAQKFSEEHGYGFEALE